MYSISSEDNVTAKYLPAGKHENVTLLKIVKEPMSSKNEDSQTVLRFYFDKEGYAANITEMPINEELLTGWGKSADDIKKEYKWKGQKLFHILNSFIPESKIKIEGETWEELCDNIVELAGEAFRGQTFRTKFVYNNSGFLEFPKYAFSPFIRNMKQLDDIVINPKYDKMELPKPEAVEDIKKEDDLF